MKKNTLNLIITIVVATALLLMAHACKNVESTTSHIEVIDETTDSSEPILDPQTYGEYDETSEEVVETESVEEVIIEPVILSLSVCSSIVDREPIDDLAEIELSTQKIYTHTVVKSPQVDTIFLVYKFEGEEIARVALNVGESPRWRTWSSKYLDPMWVGDWSVEIQSQQGSVLATKQFSVIETSIEEDNTEEFEETKLAPESVSLVIENSK